MRGYEKGAIRVAVALIAVGLLVFAGTLAASGFNPLEMSRRVSGYEERTERFDGAFSELHIRDVDANIRVLPSEDGRCSVHYDQTERSTYRVNIVNDALVIERERHWLDSFGIFMSAPKLTVYLPRTAYDRIDARTVSGSIQVEELAFESAELETTSGGIRLTDVRVASGPAFRTLDGGSSDAGCLRAKTVSGGIRLEGVDAESLELRTVSGSIKGTLLSGKVFEASSVSGQIRVPESTPGAGVCRAATTSGSISISIEA